MKKLLAVLVVGLIYQLTYAQDQNEKNKANEYIMLGNASVNGKVYSLKSKSEKFEFSVQVCASQDNCKITQSFAKDVSTATFADAIINFINTEFDSSVIDAAGKFVLRTGEKEFLESLIKKRTEQELQILQEQKDDLQKTLEVIDKGENQYSGKLVLNKDIPFVLKYPTEASRTGLGKLRKSKKIKYLTFEQRKKIALNNLNSELKTLEKKKKEAGSNTVEVSKYQAEINKVAADIVNKKAEQPLNKYKLSIIDSKVKFFNNKATSIYIKAEFHELDPNDSSKIISTQKLIFLNNKFSVAIRWFNYYGSKVSATTDDGLVVEIDYNDVFDYESDQYYNYSVANDQISLSTVSPDSSSSKVRQRSFFDYFTGIVYSDVLSFNTENSNSLLNAQAKLLVPLNLRNPGIWSFARQFTATANVALNNSFADSTRFIAIKDSVNFNHFDLLQKSNLQGKLEYQAINLEYKRLFMNISLGYSAAFYRTGLKYTLTSADSTGREITRQLISLGHGPFINFEIRPQSNFGADLLVSFEDLNYNGPDTINDRSFRDEIIEDRGHNHLGFKYNLVNIEANFYWLTSKERSGGVYAKIGSYYHTESHELFPQIMVGYATNLTSFVNRFKSDKPDTN